ncbi:MAG: glycosyltransferase [Alphaproteobacteria bacterium]|nr:glycosyltransferase [Alphaproteobacteria bacterium]
MDGGTQHAAGRLRERLWASEAASGLATRKPQHSARLALTRSQGLVLTLSALVLAGAVLFQPAVVIALFSLGFLALVVLRLHAAFSIPERCARQPLQDSLLPHIALLLPAYKEAPILPHLARSIAALDYPADRLEVILALEAEDEETCQAAQELVLPRHFKIVRVPDGFPRTKPRALNFALRHSQADIIGILDAEDRPSPQQVREVAETFATAPDDIACLQAPLNWYNRQDTWLTGQFAMEYAAHFNVMLPLYQRLGWPLPLGGTSNYFRRQSLESAGGWDAFNVTEDADLGFRLAAHGLRTVMIGEPTLEEAPLHVRAWVMQRSRWLKGYAQTLAVHLRRQDGAHPTIRSLSIIVSLGAALVSALAHAPLALFSIIYLFGGWSGGWAQCFALAFLLSGYASTALCAWIGSRRAGFRPRRRDFLLMPVYWLLQTIAAIRALWQWAINPYLWDKTEHGQSKACTSP